MRKIFLFLNLIILSLAGFSQTYKPVIGDNYKWLVAHKQLAGDYIDTIYTQVDTGGWYKLNYHGVFYNRQVKKIGYLKSSKNNDTLWFVESGYPAKIIFDLNLQEVDSFSIDWMKYKVDSVKYVENKKYIYLNGKNHWDEKLSIIEGVGVSYSFIPFVVDFTMLNPQIVCMYENDLLVYSTLNENFIDCNLNSVSLPEEPNATCSFTVTDDYINIVGCNDSHNKTKYSLLTITGEIVASYESSDANISIDRTKVEAGLYMLLISSNSVEKSYKIVLP
ncbi:MAG: hypothetical protein IPO21_09285 [Bacteroidales bacterium]|nr:hypothetical protein [Bacteroidales bacterium]